MAEELLSLKWNNHQSHFVDILSYLREQEIFIDASIACGGKVYQAHKFVLSTCSEYFKQMFAVNKSPHPIVFMKDVSCKDIEALLDFMYHGEVNVPQSSLGSLIKTAEGLQIKGLAVPDDPPSNKRERDGSSTLGSPPSKKPMREKSPPNRYNKVSSQNNLSSKSSSSRPKSPSDSSSRNDKDRLKNSNERTSLSSLEGEPPSTRHSKVELPDKDPSEPSSAIASEEDNSTDNNNSDGTSAQPTKMLHPSKQEEVEIKQEEDIVQLDDEDEGLDPSDDWMGHHNENSLGSENNSTMFAPDLLMHDVDAVMGGAGASSNQANNMAGTSQGTDSAMDWLSSLSSLSRDSGQELNSLILTGQSGYGSPPKGVLDLQDSTFEKRHICPICQKAFHRKDHFNQHVRVHTGEKPYICPHCRRAFTQRTPLITHIRHFHDSTATC